MWVWIYISILYFLALTMLTEMAIESWITLALSGHSVTGGTVPAITQLVAVSAIPASWTL